LKTIKSIKNGEEITSNGLCTPSQANVAQKEIDRPVKMEITQRRDYPFFDPWPRLLTELSASDCRLTEFDSRLLKIKSLACLTLYGNDFSNGRLNDISMANLTSLHSLNLNECKIDELSEKFCRGLPSTLRHLSLRLNLLTELPDALFDKLQLKSLDLFSNRLSYLNWNISNMRSSLRSLWMNNNQLKILPAAVTKLRLSQADFTNNPFMNKNEVQQDELGDSESTIPRLFEMAANILVKHK
jgi:hypothetical protein